MKLHYWHSANFGDALNVWLWPKLLPDFFDEDDSELLVGIGTLLNSHLPLEPRKLIFGSGVGYGTGTPCVDERWRVYCVRGPLSARALHLSDDVGIIDPAVLIRRFVGADTKKRFRVSFMPHWESTIFLDWQDLCESNGIHFIDPLGSVEKTIGDIADSELIMAEAMHGAIVADALRVPWVPLAVYDQVLPFKWHDWCGSLGMEYHPVRLLPVFSSRWTLIHAIERLRCCRARRVFPHLLLRDNVLSKALLSITTRVFEVRRASYDRRAISDLTRQLTSIANGSNWTLSHRDIMENAIERLDQQLHQLRQDRSRCQLSAS